MENKLQIFNFNSNDIRTFVDELCNIWFCLKDVCDVLGIVNNRDTVSRLDKDGVVTTDGVDSLGRRNTLTFINEPNLYLLVFQSRKPEAKDFTKWITNDVIPSIRKTGGYGQSDLSNLDILVNVAIQLRDQDRLLKQQQKDLQEMKQIQEQAISELEYIPTSENKAKDVTIRKAITMLVRNYAIRKAVNIKECWDNLYYQFKYRYSFDVDARYKNCDGKTSKIDIIEKEGRINDLFDLASEMFK